MDFSVQMGANTIACYRPGFTDKLRAWGPDLDSCLRLLKECCGDNRRAIGRIPPRLFADTLTRRPRPDQVTFLPHQAGTSSLFELASDATLTSPHVRRLRRRPRVRGLYGISMHRKFWRTRSPALLK